VIEKLYKNSVIESRVNGIKISFDSLSGVKQGDNLAPVLFLFAIQAALNQMDVEWGTALTELVMSDKMTTRPTKKSLPIMIFSRSLFADDSAFLFGCRNEMISAMKLIVRCFSNFGLEVHLGNKDTASKTEAMFFPGRLCDQSTVKDEAAVFEVMPRCFVSFCDKFVYLGSQLTPDLNDKFEITRRVGLAHGQMKCNEPVLRNKKLPLKVRANMYMAFVVNTLLYGCDTWTIGAHDYEWLSSFQTKMWLLNLSMHDVKAYRIKNETILERVGLSPMRQIIWTWQLHFLERIALMIDDCLPRMMIGSHVTCIPGEQAQKGNVGTTRSMLRSTLEIAGLWSKGSGGDLKEWIPKIKDPTSFQQSRST
jgi:hypothetical protein